MYSAHNNKSATYTLKTEDKQEFERWDDFGAMNALRAFMQQHADLYEAKREDLYMSFCIPKHSGGLRHIDAPKDALKYAMYELKEILETHFNARYHTSAFAFVKNRSTVDAIKKHQANESKYFLKTDFSDFFGSTTKEFVASQLKMIYPFYWLDEGEFKLLMDVLDICFLGHGLPQGTPLSPMLTNIVMIPIDFELFNYFRSNHFVYTRYADDMLISSKNSFMFTKQIEEINRILREFNAPYSIKPTKTRYGSSSGENWNLGLMLNKDNQITIGHKRKDQFRAMMMSYIRDSKAGTPWPMEDVYHLQGLMSYYLMIERDGINKLIERMNERNGVDIEKMIKDQIRKGNRL